MFVINKFLASLFSLVIYAVLRISGWKRKAVFANLLHVSLASVQPVDLPRLYRRLLCNLSRHVGELLSCFGIYKKLPADTAVYPCRLGGQDFCLADGSAPVLEQMRRGGLFLTAHFGNYEAIGPWLCRLGIPLVASYIPVRPAWLNRILDRRIRSVDGRPYGIDARTPREFVRLLDEGKLFCLLADQDSRITSALPGTFLGQSANMNPLPDFLLRHRPGTPVYVCWLEESCNCRILHAEELEFRTNENSPSPVIDSYNCWLETRIKENPSLWYGFTHRRFYSENPEIYF